MPGRARPRPGAADAGEKPAAPGAHIWVLRDGHPTSIAVKLGLSDGFDTEISGDGLTEGLLVITRANTPSA
jgi:HlyD family secretion protein